jgi:hypothetical protein
MQYLPHYDPKCSFGIYVNVVVFDQLYIEKMIDVCVQCERQCLLDLSAVGLISLCSMILREERFTSFFLHFVIRILVTAHFLFIS